MNASESQRPASPQPPGRARNPLPLIATFFLGAVATALWFHHQSAAPVAPATIGLSDSTKAELARLAAPVTIHYYSLLGGNTDQRLQGFAERAAQLLGAMQDASAGKLRVVTIDTPAETNANAASAEGLQAFNLDKGASDFLGVTLASGKNAEAIARLDPAYEPALESDLMRAILRVAIAPTPAPQAHEVAKPSSETVASIHRLIPDMAGTTPEAASEIFHMEFLKELSDAGTVMETQMEAAQQRVVAAQTNGSPEELAAAQKNLAQVQLAQGEKMRQIAAELKTRQAVFLNMKNQVSDAK